MSASISIFRLKHVASCSLSVFLVVSFSSSGRNKQTRDKISAVTLVYFRSVHPSAAVLPDVETQTSLAGLYRR